jgi:hypothetical protein
MRASLMRVDYQFATERAQPYDGPGMFDDKRSKNGTFDMITVSVIEPLEL